MSWTGSINSGATWTRPPRNARGVRRIKRSLKRSALELQRCRGSAPSGGAHRARPSCPPGLTRRTSARVAERICTVAGSARFLTRAAGSNAPGPLQRGSPKRTPGMSAPFSPREPRLNVRLLPRNLLTRARLLKTSSKSNRRAASLLTLLPGPEVLPPSSQGRDRQGYPKIFWRAASEMVTTAGF